MTASSSTPARTPDSEQAYSAKLRETGALLSRRRHFTFRRTWVTPAKAEGATGSLGFRLVETLGLPGGRQARLWWRP
jgi:hypothetical protein